MREGCADCLVDDLKELLEVLSEPECRQVLEEHIHTSLKCFGKKTLDDLERLMSAIPSDVPELEIYRPTTVRLPSMVSQETAVPPTATHGDGSVYGSVDEEPAFHSPREVQSPSSGGRIRFHPSVVRGSAFGSSAGAVVPSSRPEAQNNRPVTPPGMYTLNLGPIKPRASWTAEQVEDLTAGYSRYGSSWERIRKVYPRLQQYTGMQLKDKYRAISK